MGFRNPFRMSVDKATGIVYLGDYGPDAGAADPNRGPGGQVEFDRITGPGNYGWPYCTGTNTTAETYNEYNFPTAPPAPSSTAPAGPTNNSFRNTGLGTLPPAKPSWIRYGGEAGSPPEFGGGSESPMGGPVYRYDATLNSGVKFPQSLNGRYFAGEYGRTLDQGRSRSTSDGTPRRRSTTSRGRAPRSWTWSSAPTARCTSSTTAPATATTRRSTASSTSAAANRSPIAKIAGEPDVRPRPARR